MTRLIIGAAIEWVRDIGPWVSSLKINQALGVFLCPRRYTSDND